MMRVATVKPDSIKTRFSLVAMMDLISCIAREAVTSEAMRLMATGRSPT